ncbi:hypothetical protein QQP08_014156 [Theobroma cacao]|nr:hypothetical protein QQP08_014156 [Theobroma cacao]
MGFGTFTEWPNSGNVGFSIVPSKRQGHSKPEFIWYFISKHRKLNKSSDCNNNITGPIPTELGKLSKIQTLDLSDNSFTGEIPTSLGNLRSLQYM